MFQVLRFCLIKVLRSLLYKFSTVFFILLLPISHNIHFCILHFPSPFHISFIISYIEIIIAFLGNFKLCLLFLFYITLFNTSLSFLCFLSLSASGDNSFNIIISFPSLPYLLICVFITTIFLFILIFSPFLVIAKIQTILFHVVVFLFLETNVQRKKKNVIKHKYVYKCHEYSHLNLFFWA